MNESQWDQKIQPNVTWAKNDLITPELDGIDNVSQVSENWDHFTEDLTAVVNSGGTLLSSEFEKVKDDTTRTVAQATTTVKREVGRGLSQYNAKATEFAKKLPGDVGLKAGMYPWVAMSFALLAGFFLRGIFIPRRNHHENNLAGCTQNMG